jgi:hypothetical protein
MLTRRQLLRLVPAGLLAGAVPRAARADISPAQRRFLFVFCYGGWDPTYVFAPMFGNANVTPEDGAEPATIGGIPIVDHPDRPTVRSFFEAHAARACVLNGFEVRSVTHERCQRLLFTGRGSATSEDWPSILASSSSLSLQLPYLVMSGPSYTYDLTSSVVRVGESGQLAKLLSDQVFLTSDIDVTGLTSAGEDAVDGYLRQRAAAYAAAAGAGGAARYGELYDRVLGQLDDLRALDLDLSSSNEITGVEQSCGQVFPGLATAMSALSAGVSRCAMVEYRGFCSNSFDNHSDIPMMSTHFELLFQHLEYVMDQMQALPGAAGGSLLDETVLVVLSEMGRHPQVNSQGGKDHWTFTSAMLVGSGVQGGRVIGALDENVMGEAVDLASGDVSEGGTSLEPSHVGATLLALGDVDPREWGDADPIQGVIA